MNHPKAEGNAEPAVQPAGLASRMQQMIGDDVLIARGLYSTLNKERREQMERVQKICTSMVTASSQVLKNCHERVPANEAAFATIAQCMENLVKANERLMTLGAGLNELEDEAWGKNQQETA